MSRLNSTRTIADRPCRGTDAWSLPDSGAAQVADGMIGLPMRPNAAPDAPGRTLQAAIGCLRGGLREEC